LSVLLAPVVPDATKKIYSLLGLADDLTDIDPAELHWGGLNAGTNIRQTEGIFPRIDKSNVMSEIKANTEQGQGPATADAAATTSTATGPTDTATAEDNFITIDDFLKVELRVGEIKVAERIPNADKLLRFEIDLGEDKPRQILAGLAEYYEPEKLIGRKVVVVANLKPRKMRGLESQGMICAASLGQDDTPAIATFIENVEIGARLK
jgi:methionyl-tRNA synthetase